MNGDYGRICIDLIDGRLDAVRVPSVISRELCDGVLRALREVRFDWYDESRVFPPIARFGPTLNDFTKRGMLRSDYWPAMAEVMSSCKDVPSLTDIHSVALKRLSELLARPVGSATIGGRRVYCGTVREMSNGARVHFDDVATEFLSFPFDQRVLTQLSFVVCLSAPRAGGETVIWERGPVAEDENSRVGYGYDESVVADLAFVKFRPIVGDGLLFRCDRLHSVMSAEEGRRVSLNFFVGVTDEQTAVVWS